MTTSLPETAFTTPQRVKREIDDLPEPQIIDLIVEASRTFREKTDRKFFQETGAVEWTEAGGGYTIFVNDHLPISNIQSVEYQVDQNTLEEIDPSYYMIEGDGEMGSIVTVGGDWPSTLRHQGFIEAVPDGLTETVKVTYDGGLKTPAKAWSDGEERHETEFPFDIERAVIEWVVWKAYDRGMNPTIKKQSVLDGSVTFKENPSMPPETWEKTVRSYYDYDV